MSLSAALVMRTKLNPSLHQMTKLGGPQGGTASALAIGRNADGYTLFLGGPVGLYRAVEFGAGAAADWERLPHAPIGIVSLAVSPNFTHDQTLFAGTTTGLFVSDDGGDTWLAGKMPLMGSVVNVISFSPDYAVDGSLLAGTLEDGIVFSNTRGISWSSRNFGLLDAAVFSIAFSPNFAKDETGFAGTDTAVYHSYNGGRAWKMVDFPEEAPPAMSLAVSPGFEHDRTLFVGTEAEGLFRSTDAGATWAPLSLPAACINALLFRQTGDILAATDAGVFWSQDQGETWACVLDQPDVISLAARDEVVLAGPAGLGVWVTTDLQNWQAAENLAALPVVGLALPDAFDQDGVALMFGPSEGIWRTVDGGGTWKSMNDDLPTLGVAAVALSPRFAVNQVAAAASDAGVLLSEDGGQHWNTVLTEPSALAAFSPNGKRLAAGLTNGEIRASDDLGKTWTGVRGASEAGGRVASLAVGNPDQLYVAIVEGIGETLSIWQGKPGEFEKVHSQAAGENPVVALWIPAEVSADRPWYAAIGNQVLKFSSRKGRTAIAAIVFDDSDQTESILSLTGVQGQGEQMFIAATGRHVYKSADGQAWSMAHDFGNDRAVSVSVSPNYLKDKTIYALLIGGTFSRLNLR